MVVPEEKKTALLPFGCAQLPFGQALIVPEAKQHHLKGKALKASKQITATSTNDEDIVQKAFIFAGVQGRQICSHDDEGDCDTVGAVAPSSVQEMKWLQRAAYHRLEQRPAEERAPARPATTVPTAQKMAYRRRRPHSSGGVAITLPLETVQKLLDEDKNEAFRSPRFFSDTNGIPPTTKVVDAHYADDYKLICPSCRWDHSHRCSFCLLARTSPVPRLKMRDIASRLLASKPHLTPLELLQTLDRYARFSEDARDMHRVLQCSATTTNLSPRAAATFCDMHAAENDDFETRLIESESELDRTRAALEASKQRESALMERLKGSQCVEARYEDRIATLTHALSKAHALEKSLWETTKMSEEDCRTYRDDLTDLRRRHHVVASEHGELQKGNTALLRTLVDVERCLRHLPKLRRKIKKLEEAKRGDSVQTQTEEPDSLVDVSADVPTLQCEANSVLETVCSLIERRILRKEMLPDGFSSSLRERLSSHPRIYSFAVVTGVAHEDAWSPLFSDLYTDLLTKFSYPEMKEERGDAISVPTSKFVGAAMETRLFGVPQEALQAHLTSCCRKDDVDIDTAIASLLDFYVERSREVLRNMIAHFGSQSKSLSTFDSFVGATTKFSRPSSAQSDENVQRTIWGEFARRRPALSSAKKKKKEKKQLLLTWRRRSASLSVSFSPSRVIEGKQFSKCC